MEVHEPVYKTQQPAYNANIRHNQTPSLPQ